jgi:hypothetical protein
VEKGCGMVDIVQIPCSHVYKWKNETCCYCSGNESWGDKGK